MPDWSIERLNERHEAGDFDCGKPSLSDWIRRYAGQNERWDVSRTFVAVRPGTFRVEGYYCLSSFQIGFEALPVTKSRKLPRNQAVPAALLGRLAVAKHAQGQGLGSVLLGSALSRIVSLDREIAIHSVVVHALDEDARQFYLKQGFEPLLDDPLHLFISMKVIRQIGLESSPQAAPPPPEV